MDFTRYTVDQKAQVVGQVLGLPPATTFFAALVCLMLLTHYIAGNLYHQRRHSAVWTGFVESNRCGVSAEQPHNHCHCHDLLHDGHPLCVYSM
jgi:hypothetical protein